MEKDHQVIILSSEYERLKKHEKNFIKAFDDKKIIYESSFIYCAGVEHPRSISIVNETEIVSKLISEIKNISEINIMHGKERNRLVNFICEKKMWNKYCDIKK